MSDTPPQGDLSFRQRQRHRRRHESSQGKWIGVAVAAHVVMIALLVLTPLGTYLFSADASQSKRKNISSDMVEELAEQIKEVNRKKLRDEIKQLEDLLVEMQKLKEERAERYVSNTADQPLEAPQNALTEMLLAYEQLVGSAQSVAQYGKHFEPGGKHPPVQTRIESNITKPDAWLHPVELLQGEVAEHQQQSTYRLAVAAFDIREVLELQDQAIASQAKADASHASVKRLNDMVKLVETTQHQVKRSTTVRDGVKNKIDKLEQRIASSEARLPQREKDIKQSEKLLTRYLDEVPTIRATNDAEQIDRWESRIENARKGLKTRQTRLSNDRKSIEKDNASLLAERPQLAEREAQLKVSQDARDRAVADRDRVLGQLGGQDKAFEGAGLTLIRDQLQVAADQKAAIDALVKAMQQEQQVQEEVVNDIKKTIEQTLADAKTLAEQLAEAQQKNEQLQTQTTDASTKQQVEHQQTQIQEAVAQTQQVVEKLSEVQTQELTVEQLQQLSETMKTVSKIAPKAKEIVESVESVHETSQQVVESTKQDDKSDPQQVQTSVELKKKTEQADQLAKQLDKKLVSLKKMSERLDEMMHPQIDATAVQAESSQSINTSNMDLTQLYKAAQQVESQITGSYRDIQAMNLAEFAQMTLDEATAHTDLVQVERETANQELLSESVRTQARLAELRGQLNTLDIETQAMLSLAEMLRDEAAHASEMAGQELELSLAALTLGEGEGEGQGQGGANSGQNKEQGGAKNRQGQGAKAADSLVKIAGEKFPYKEVDSIGRTHIAQPGQPGGVSGWIAIDTWYIIGPYDNPGRRYIKRKFHPESAVDLDAQYTGKYDKPIEWVFTQTNHPDGQVRPHNSVYLSPEGNKVYESWAIWYCYAEVQVEVPGEYLMAMGCDDFAKVWINDELIWTSPESHKSWNPSEHTAMQYLTEGTNRILFRLENGQHGCGMSVHIFVEPSANADAPSSAR